MRVLRCVKRIFSWLSCSPFVIKIGHMRVDRHTITSVSEVIDALGGTSRAAGFMKVGSSAVSNMLNRNVIPSAYHLRVYLRLTDLGYDVDVVAVFGYALPPAIEGNGSPTTSEIQDAA